MVGQLRHLALVEAVAALVIGQRLDGMPGAADTNSTVSPAWTGGTNVAPRASSTATPPSMAGVTPFWPRWATNTAPSVKM